jgi:DNA-binding NarL/FixJ family response regulator
MELVLWASTQVPPSPVSISTESDSADAKAAKVRLLIVEDDFLVADELEHTLTNAGYEVVGVAASADEAVELTRTHDPAVVIMDVRLNGSRDGVDAAIEIFNQFGIRCIFATAHADEHTLQRARSASPLGWVQKPYPARSLIELIAKAI